MDVISYSVLYVVNGRDILKGPYMW